MTYADALARLFALRRFGVRPGTEELTAALARLGNPERAFSAIHVAGTNGKGSTAAICEAILRADGRRTGLYTSPHLARLTERIRIDGDELGEAETAALADEVLEAGPTLTFFEVVTAMAFLAFARAGVELAVVEVGLGGRLDSTQTLARPLVSIVTSIGLDHTELLGDTTAAIAREKAGIFRAGIPAVIGRVDDAARVAIADHAATVGAPVAWLGVDFPAIAVPALHGAHQADNAGLAVAAVQRLPIAPGARAIEVGLASARWPGRLEQLAEDLIVDGAHNADGAAVLAAALPALAGDRPIHLVLGVVEEKDARALAAPLIPLCARLIVTTVPSPRARPAAALAALLDVAHIEQIDEPMAAVLAARRPGALTVVAGSLFLVGHVRARLLDERVDPIVAQDPAPVVR